MDIYKLIVIECNKKNINISYLEKTLGLSNGSIKKWQSSVPKADTLLKVAHYLGISVEYILGESVQPQQSNLDDFQIALCGATSDLSKEDKDKIMSYVNFVKNKEK